MRKMISPPSMKITRLATGWNSLAKPKNSSCSVDDQSMKSCHGLGQ